MCKKQKILLHSVSGQFPTEISPTEVSPTDIYPTDISPKAFFSTVSSRKDISPTDSSLNKKKIDMDY